MKRPWSRVQGPGQPQVGGLVLLAMILLLMPAVPVGLPTHPSSVLRAASPPNSADPLLRPLRGDGSGPPVPVVRPSPLQEQVNPYAYYTNEPAPMGIADFGVDPWGNAYSYTTDEFVGSANITELSLYNSALKGQAHVGSLQLNVVLAFPAGGYAYRFWVQDTVTINTSANRVDFLDNIWNLTAGSNRVMPNTTVRPGSNGSVLGSGFNSFYAAGAADQPGNDVILSYPTSIVLRVRSDLAAGGIPEVYFDFNDGHGWQTYDTVEFFASEATSAQFIVDGGSYLQGGVYQDAELDFGGPGDLATTRFTRADVNLSLEYDNGHNLQSVPNAFNFGGDTGETSSNVSATLAVQATTGDLLSHLACNTTGTLSNLYDRNETAILNGTTTLLNGTYSINGVDQGNFSRGGLNLTLSPGTYSIELTPAVGGEVVGDITLVSGEYLAYDFNPPPEFDVTFLSLGLPSGTNWGVRLNGTGATTDSPGLTVPAVNGSYGFTVDFLSGWQPSPTSGTVRINGDGVDEEIHWTRVTYPLTVVPSGLPAFLPWSIRINGSLLSSAGGALETMLPNGTYGWTVGAVPGYRSVVTSSVVQINNGSTVLDLVFLQEFYPIEVEQSGLPAGSEWGILIDGFNLTSNGVTVNLTLPNGSYQFTAYTSAPYNATEGAGSLEVNGTARSLVLEFAPLPAVIFGSVFPSDAVLQIDGATETVEGGAYSVQLPPGSYVINVTAAGYDSGQWSIVAAPGERIPLNLTLQPLPPASPAPNPLGGWLPATLAALVAIAAVTGAGVVLLRRRSARR